MTEDRSISRQVESSGFYEHNLLIYSDLDTFSDTYCAYTKKHLLPPHNEIVVIVTYYQKVDKVLSNLSDQGIDVDREMAAGNLVVLDSVASYHAEDTHTYVLKLAESLVEKSADDAKGGVCVFGDGGSFFLLDKIAELLQYERSIPPKPGLKLKTFCSYHQGDYKRLSEEEKKMLVTNHFRRIQTNE